MQPLVVVVSNSSRGGARRPVQPYRKLTRPMKPDSRGAVNQRTRRVALAREQEQEADALERGAVTTPQSCFARLNHNFGELIVECCNDVAFFCDVGCALLVIRQHLLVCRCAASLALNVLAFYV